jgi:hypothetical protein
MEIAGRDVERSILVQIGAGSGSVLVFLALVVYVGVRWTSVVETDPIRVVDLTPEGGLMLVVVLVVFVVFMSVIGLVLSDDLSEDDEAAGDDESDGDDD